MSRLSTMVHSRRAFLAGSLIWLPFGLMLTFIVRFPEQLASPMGWLSLLPALASLIIVAPCGLPLALACRRLWRLGYREAAWATMAVLGLVTVAVTVVAGLLGPVAIAACATILSLPVWIAAAIVGRLRKNGAR